MNRLLRLTLLAPDIQEAILDGRQPKGLQLEELTRRMPSGWAEQRESVVISQSALSTPRGHTGIGRLLREPLSNDLTASSDPDRGSVEIKRNPDPGIEP